jgi:hypothetical protein
MISTIQTCAVRCQFAVQQLGCSTANHAASWQHAVQQFSAMEIGLFILGRPLRMRIPHSGRVKSSSTDCIRFEPALHHVYVFLFIHFGG